MTNYHEFRIGKVDFILWLDTKHHQWKVYFGRRLTREDFKSPDFVFTKAKGDAVYKFVRELLENLKRAIQVTD